VFLDTNVFLYAIGAESPHREPCRDALLAAGDGHLDAVTSSEVLQEILHVRTRRVNLRDGIKAARSAAAMVAEVLPVTGDDVLAACKILERYTQISARDALHVAVMKASHIQTLISVDKDFDAIKDIRRVDPKDATKSA
jgi:predicted nucleic acid-binding protein